MHLGIDFGTSYTKLGCWEAGEFINLAGEEKRIPTVAAWLSSQDKIYFGLPACRLNEAGAQRARFFKLALKRNPAFCLGPFPLAVIMREFFRFLRQEYIASQDITIDSITLSTPNYFGLNARRIMLESARQVFATAEIFLLPEPLAAVSGYNLSHPQNPLQGDILSIDIGGGTTDFSFLRILQENRDIMLETQFQIGNDAFSGSEIDRGILRRLLLPGFTMQTGQELGKSFFEEKFHNGEESMNFDHLMNLAEKVKIELSHKEHLYLNIPDFIGRQSLLMEIDQDLFALQLSNVYERLRTFFLQAVMDRARTLGLYDKQGWNLNHILLQGGAAQSRGLKELVEDLCPGVNLICPSDPDFNVVKGLCFWNPEMQQTLGGIKSIYPFNFYMNKMNPPEDTLTLERIPFDTTNLELDIRQRYRIFTFAADSGYNLAVDPDRAHFKIYEVEEDDSQVEPERFQGREPVWQLDAKADELPDYIEVYLDLAGAKLESSLSLNSSPEQEFVKPELLQDYYSKQVAAWQLIKSYKPGNQSLINDFGHHLASLGKDADSSSEYTDTIIYKVLCLLDFLTPG